MKIDLQRVRELSGMGLTQAQVASGLGIGARTLSRRLAEDEEFAEAFEAGAAALTQEMANVLVEAARRGDIDAAKFILDRRCGWKATTKQELSIASHQPSINIILTNSPAQTGQTIDHAELP